MIPTISVIVPVYKVEDYIYRCIDSVLIQTFTDFELILVDDGSPDNCGMICDAYALKDARVKVIHKKNGGVSTGRNSGITNSKGEFIYFLDSDDYLEPESLQMAYEHIKKHNTDIVIFGYYYVKDDIRFSRLDLAQGYYSKYEFINNFKEFGNEIYYNSPINKLYKREIIIDNHILFEDGLQMGEDLLFNLQYFSYCNSFYILNMDLYNHFVNNSNSLMHRYFGNFNVIQKKLMSEVKSFFEENQLNPINHRLLNLYFLNNLHFTINHYMVAKISSIERKNKIRETLSENADIKLLNYLNKKDIMYYILKYSIILKSYWMYILFRKVLDIKVKLKQVLIRLL